MHLFILHVLIGKLYWLKFPVMYTKPQVQASVSTCHSLWQEPKPGPGSTGPWLLTDGTTPRDDASNMECGLAWWHGCTRCNSVWKSEKARNWTWVSKGNYIFWKSCALYCLSSSVLEVTGSIIWHIIPKTYTNGTSELLLVLDKQGQRWPPFIPSWWWIPPVLRSRD